jgi:hypothetical protein
MGWVIKYDLTQNKIWIFIDLHLTTFFPNLQTYFSTYIPTYLSRYLA